jgi:hypothetical protein
MTASEARQVRLVGAVIAAVSGPVVIAALFVDWYGRSAFCLDVGCLALVRSGWESLGVGKAVILAAGVLGLAPLAAEALPARWRTCIRGLAGLAGLGAALVIVHRIGGRAPANAGPMGSILQQFLQQFGSTLLAGPWIALVACLGVAGGSLLAGIGSDFFAPARSARSAAGVIWTACAVAVVTLWLPWTGSSAQAFGVLTLSGASGSGWHALHTLAALLLLGVIATAGGAVIAAWFRWRAVFLALAVAGWLLAAFAAVGALRPAGTLLEVVGQPVAHKYGYWLFLGCAAVIVLSGVAAATAAPQRSTST